MNRVLILLLAAASLGGCSTLVSNAASQFSDNLSAAMLNQDDPELVRDGAPTLLLTIDSFVEGDPENPTYLAAAATLYATYGAVFADDAQRASRLTSRARRYAQDAMCGRYEPSCTWPDMTHDEFVATLEGITAKEAETLYTYGFASLAYLRAHSSDWNSLAELPQIEALLGHYIDISGDEVNSAVYTYMGILLTLRPPALGGEPERAKSFFERAIEATGGDDLSISVEYAKSYAKLLYERELHDELLTAVIDADPYKDGFVLGNVMAQEEAKALLSEADDYF